MTLEELFQQLSYGELSNLSVAVDGSGTIKKEKQNQIVHFANEALRKLHMRLPLREVNHIVTLTPGSDLDYDFKAVPEIEGAITVTSILTSYGTSLPFTMDQKIENNTIYIYNGVMHVPRSIAAVVSELQVTFRLHHPALKPINSPIDLTQTIELSIEDLEPAIRAYIAFRVYSGMNTPDSTVIAANYRAMYEQTINDVLNTGLLSHELLQSSKLDMRGFV